MSLITTPNSPRAESVQPRTTVDADGEPLVQLGGSRRSLLENSAVRELRNAQRHGAGVVSVLASDTVESALSVMKRGRFLAVPVQDDTVKGMFIGILSLRDVLAAAMFQPVFSAYNTDEKLISLSSEQLSAVFDSIFDAEVLRKPVRELLAASTSRQLVLEPSESIDVLAQLMAQGVHRVLVRMHDQDPPMIMASQTDLVAWLARHAQHADIAPEMDRSVASLGLVADPAAVTTAESAGAGTSAAAAATTASATTAGPAVVTLSHKSTALTGFRRMALASPSWSAPELNDPSAVGVSALPVVDDDGRVIATLSASELRGLDTETFHRVVLNVMDFLRVEHGYTVPAPATCHASSTLRHVLHVLAENKTHRVWVVDAERRPIGVVSLTDIIALFAAPRSTVTVEEIA